VFSARVGRYSLGPVHAEGAKRRRERELKPLGSDFILEARPRRLSRVPLLPCMFLSPPPNDPLASPTGPARPPLGQSTPTRLLPLEAPASPHAVSTPWAIARDP
jgi:hypothetical protein